eukprot:6990348-Prymnesium_polylepis.1
MRSACCLSSAARSSAVSSGATTPPMLEAVTAEIAFARPCSPRVIGVSLAAFSAAAFAWAKAAATGEVSTALSIATFACIVEPGEDAL